MKIENRELLEQMFGKILAVLRNPNSTAAEVLEAYNSKPEKEPENPPYIDYDDRKRFERHVVKAAFTERITILRDGAKTFDEAFMIWKGIPKDKFKEPAGLKALSLANCLQALAVYRYAPAGLVGSQALERAARLAKTQEQLWQVAFHSKQFGNKKLWKQAVKKLATKLK